jgi:alanyl-tRNA synthetase
VERTLAVLNGLDDNYLTSIFYSVIKKIELISGEDYLGREREMRIITDHVRAAVFILGDSRGIRPGNIGQGYILRRLIRRAVRFGRMIGIKDEFLGEIAKEIILIFGKDYEELEENRGFILNELRNEEGKFSVTLGIGLKKFGNLTEKSKKLSGKDAFLLFQSYGFPIEMTLELAMESGKSVDVSGFDKELKKHQKLSRTASAGVFKSGMADDSVRTKRLHTATHLLNAALKKVLKSDVKQKGSNITSERLRFDFSFDRKLTDSEKEKVENLVNIWISKGIEVKREEMTLNYAIKSGAEAEFGAKYPSMVSVYIVGSGEELVSREICTGPHVENTEEIGKFRILKEESSSSGVRRIKATIE